MSALKLGVGAEARYAGVLQRLLKATVLSAALAGGVAWAEANTPVREVSLQAQTRVEVAQDWLQLRLGFNNSGEQAKDVQKEVNDALAAALKLSQRAAAKAQADTGPLAMRVRTGGSQVHPRHDRNGRIERWNGSAELVIEGLDLPAIQAVAANVNQFVLRSSSMSVSAGLQAQTESALMLDAIAAFKDKAQAATQAFGYQSFEVAQVSVSGNSPAQPMMRAAPMAMSMAMDSNAMAQGNAPLEVQAGWQWVDVTVAGSITMR